MMPYKEKEPARNILDRFGRRSGEDRRFAQTCSFPFERRKADDRRKNRSDRRRELADRYWAS